MQGSSHHFNLRSVQVLLPEVLRTVQPDMKVVVMLRDPVSRLYSAFWCV
jgi:hypothetical protein